MDISPYLRELAVDKFPVVSLAKAFSVFDSHGALIITAIGNDSNSSIRDLQATASFSEVIGVASSND